jgi:tight adherence protein C
LPLVFADLGEVMQVLIPLGALAIVFAGVWTGLTMISKRNSRTQERLARISRPPSLLDIPDPTGEREERFKGIKGAIQSMGGLTAPRTELEQSELKVKLANAGFRSESAAAIYSGLRFASLIGFAGVSLIWLVLFGWTMKGAVLVCLTTGLGFFLPGIVLWVLRSQRQQAIFLTLPDALDLMVVCVESGLGLDAAMRKVCEEMKDHAKVITEELSLANFQLQMGRPRREVLHDLGVRTGVDDVRSLAAILIQADRFGSSIAQALRVQSDSMRTRRKQIAEEKAAKTAVQLIFPLVLFIFPGIFVVLVGPAFLKIMDAMKHLHQ